tara:strand:+ start:1411 stop:2133 length:723 start_codon:yes stop_codon:yes gene_type:complete
MDKTGDGIFGAKLAYSNKIKQILDKYGTKKIVKINIARSPIEQVIEKALNVISLGKWNKLRKKYYYDTLFHLSLQITLEDNTIVSFEKIDIVDLTIEKKCDDKNTECKSVPFSNNCLTLNMLVKDPLKSIPKEEYFKYSSFQYNCQDFVSKILDYFNLLTPSAKSFIYQDIQQIVEKLPFYTKWGANLVTDTLAFKKKITGAGKNKKKDKEKVIVIEKDVEKDKDLEKITNMMLDVFDPN